MRSAKMHTYAPSPLSLSRPGFDLLNEQRRSQKTINQYGESVPFLEFFSHENGLAIYNVVRSLGARRILELGCAHGCSSVYLAQGVADNGGGILVSVDPFEFSDFQGCGLQTVRRAGLGDQHQLIVERSELFLPKLVASNAEFDLVFIDTSHLYDQTIVESFFANKLLPVGGAMVFDDYGLSSVKTACNFAETNLGFVPHKIHHDAGRASAITNIRFLIKTAQDDRVWFHFKPFEVEQKDQMGPRLTEEYRTTGRLPETKADQPSSTPSI